MIIWVLILLLIVFLASGVAFSYMYLTKKHNKEEYNDYTPEDLERDVPHRYGN